MIFVLEDDESIRELLTYSLTKRGYEARGFAAPGAFYSALAEDTPELVILDIMLPEEDGLSVLARLRSNQKTAELPIVMLTAKASEFDKVTALDGGADDYITKPFGVMELLSRVNALLRRSRPRIAEEGSFTAGELTVSTSRHEVLVSGEAVTLTLKEFDLLVFLFSHRGSVLNRDIILRDVWGYEFDGENRTVDVHIRTLRQKLGAAGDVIETVRGVGYKISD